MKKHWKKVINILIYTLCVCILTAGATVLIQAATGTLDFGYGNDKDYPIFRGPRIQIDKERARSFDRFCAISGIRILDSHMRFMGFLNEEDLAIMNDINNGGEYILYFGIRDGRDVVELVNRRDANKTFCFESNLEYSFQEIIDEFERLSGVTLTDEFLTTSDFDSLLWEETGGIQIYYYVSNNKYVFYYRAEINGKMYVVN